MENKTIQCPYCEVDKEEGFIVDVRGGRYFDCFASSWHPGKPEPGMIVDAKVDVDKIVKIKAMRCPQCGHLELFAEKAIYKND